MLMVTLGPAQAGPFFFLVTPTVIAEVLFSLPRLRGRVGEGKLRLGLVMSFKICVCGAAAAPSPPSPASGRGSPTLCLANKFACAREEAGQNASPLSH